VGQDIGVGAAGFLQGVGKDSKVRKAPPVVDALADGE
jgi:hypothetical protein